MSRPIITKLGDTKQVKSAPVVLITGSAKRLGAEIARYLHGLGMRVVIHYHHSTKAAHDLQEELQATRADSVLLVQSDLDATNQFKALIETVLQHWQQLDVLINNASSFYPTPLATASEKDWHILFNSNLKAPFFLAQAAAPSLQKQHGCIINLVDIHAQRPLKDHALYCMAKAGLVTMTEALAHELGPQIRVNAIAPGAILWPSGLDAVSKQRIISKTALKRPGLPEDIARTVGFLINDAPYITGQIIAVDGGRSTAPF